MNTYYHPHTGVCIRAASRPDPTWKDVSGPTTGRLLRIRRPYSNHWDACRMHWTHTFDASAEGWEMVLWDKRPSPSEWFTGPKSGLRFGFAALTAREKANADDTDCIAVVLPDEAGWEASAQCPGARHMFQLVMLVGGAPADYVIEKLLHARRFHQCRLPRQAGLKTGFEHAFSQPDFDKMSLGTLWALATHLSDDLAEAARRLYGQDHRGGAWTRELQTLLAATDVRRN
jgi:hypothetical protein